jgi:hypothetical protein
MEQSHLLNSLAQPPHLEEEGNPNLTATPVSPLSESDIQLVFGLARRMQKRIRMCIACFTSNPA